MSSKHELYKLLLESSPYGTLFFAYGVCIECNPKALEYLGCNRADVIGTSLDGGESHETQALVQFKRQLRAALESGQGKIIWNSPLESKRQDLELQLQAVPGKPSELIVTMFEVSGQLPAERPDKYRLHGASDQDLVRGEDSFTGMIDGESAPYTSTISGVPNVHKTSVPGEWVTPGTQASVIESRFLDPVTGLPNRQYLMDTLNDYFRSHREEGICGALLMIDLDDFKNVNDSWGKVIGDQVLAKVGRTLVQLKDEDQLLVSLGSDEFMMFIPCISDGREKAILNAESIAEKIRDALSRPLFLEGQELALTCSIGIEILVDSSFDADQALQFADSAMYEAKRQGRNSIAFFDVCIAEKAQRRISLNLRMRKAIDNQEFALYIQPQVDIGTGRVIGGETLLRWAGGKREQSRPDDFIPVLESSGLIVNVGHWVIRTACEYLSGFVRDGLWQDGMQLGINVSPRQFRDPQLLEVIQHSISSYNINPKFLNFEITENLLIDDVEEVIAKMNAIRALGACFSIDDFGIGYSSMVYLKRLPFDHLKIDREFIRNIHSDPESRGVVEAIMAVSRQYGMHVIAEGVETRESLDVLCRVGCDSYQGFLYSQPLPVEGFRKLLAA